MVIWEFIGFLVFLTSSFLLLTFHHDCDENGGEFVGFGAEVLEFCCRDDAAFFKEFEPVGGFLDFAKRVAAFGGKLGPTAGAMGLAVIGTHRSPGTQELLAQNLRLSRFWQ